MSKPKPVKRVSVVTPPKRHNFDRFAKDIVKHLADRDPDEMLEPKEVANILRVGTAWLDAARVNGYGPPPKRFGPLIVLYRLGDLLTYMRERDATPEYGVVPISSNRGHHGRAVKKPTSPASLPKKRKLQAAE